jgi:Concanavalin A-like lectin/glucanases superfamily
MKRLRTCIYTALLAGAICLATAGTAGATFWSSPLAGYWPLNEGSGQLTRDWSGNGNHGTLGSTTGADENDPTWIRGIFGLGHGLNFDGGDFVTIENAPELEPSRITVETWFRSSDTSGQYRYLIAKGGEGCEAGSYGLYTSKNRGLAFYVYDGEDFTRSPEADPAQVWDGRWHHAAGTFDGRTVRLFVDGRQIGTGSPAGSEIAYGLPEGDAAFGSFGPSCDNLVFTGDLDEVRIWSRALPVSEIWDRVRALLALLRWSN